MFNCFDEFQSIISEKRNVYSMKAGLEGKKRNEVDIFEVMTFQGKKYKLIQLTRAGEKKGWQQFFDTAPGYLKAYENSRSVPDLVYADSKRIITEWIQGTQFKRKNMTVQDYEQWGEFIAKGLRDIKFKRIDSEIEDMRREVDNLVKWGVLSNKRSKNIKQYFDNGVITYPETMTEGICFGDTAHKNFIRDLNGALRYIDVFGILRGPVERVFADQIFRIPHHYRKAFVVAYEKGLPYSKEYHLPFFHLLQLVQKIHIKVIDQKNSRMFRKKYHSRKIESTVKNLNKFLDAASDGKNLEDWMMNC